MVCECCGRELDEDKEKIYECSSCGNFVCEDCISGDWECDDCYEKFSETHGFSWGVW